MDEKNYIGNLPNGKKVYDRDVSHWKNGHADLSFELLVEALGKVKIPTDEKDQVVIAQEVDMGRVVGKKTCVPVDKNDRTFMAHRKGRACDTHIVVDKEPVDHDKVVVIIRKVDDAYSLITSYIGSLTPREPGDPSLDRIKNPELRQKSKQEAEEFWASHALVYNPNTRGDFDYAYTPEGEKIDIDTFDEKYAKNMSSNDAFDIPQDATVMLMGIAASGKSTAAKVIQKRYPEAQILSSDEIREEIFAEELKNNERDKVYSKDGKSRVYNEMISRIEQNMKHGKLSIADATFLSETGKDARRKICGISRQYKRPLRVIMIKTPLELAKKLNQQRNRHVRDEVIEEMWYDYEKTRDDIFKEFDGMNNVKYRLIETQDLIKEDKDITKDLDER